jgi:hypothetical protein
MLFTIAILTLKIQLRKHDEVAAQNRARVCDGEQYSGRTMDQYRCR